MKSTTSKKLEFARKLIITIVVIGSLIAIWWFVGEWYRFAPSGADDRRYYVSFSMLEEEMKNEPMIVPDLSFELPEGTEVCIEFTRKRWGEMARRISYDVSNFVPKGTPEFEKVRIWAEPYSPDRKTVCNATLFDIDVEEYMGENSEDKEYLSEQGIPYGTFVYACYYRFDYKGCTYGISKSFALSPESLKEKNKESEKERLISEVQLVVKSILDKGEREG